ncbi:MAG: MBL fold metallo-hydrolase [Ichthyobacteriaceae bacterium]|nr:MBL fold metallo-hydrolase [Ichthyobacteriaceae bacterium]
MKISVLLENQVCQTCSAELSGEHGLSMHIALNNKNVLFDTGQTDMFASNAIEMGIDISEVDILVLSHGHYDHGGGLQKFFELNKTAKVYMHSNAINDYYSASMGEPRYIGLNKEVIEKNKQRIVYINNDIEISEGVTVLTNFKENFPKPTGNSKLYEKQNGELVSDQFKHEILLIISEADKNVVLTACSHSGIINMTNKAEEFLSGKPITAVLGGFHLSSRGRNAETPEYIGNLVSEIKKIDLQFYTGHCTGEANFKSMKGVLGDKLKSMNVGEVIEI